ncbi:MAG TPA: hypothetical protein VGG75_17415 [Trebonia sp.]
MVGDYTFPRSEGGVPGHRVRRRVPVAVAGEPRAGHLLSYAVAEVLTDALAKPGATLAVPAVGIG